MEENNQNLYEIKEKRKKYNGKLIGILLVVGVIWGIGVSVFAFVGQSKGAFNKLKGTPEEIVMAAMSNTEKKVLSEQAYMQEQLGGKTIQSIQDQKANELHFDFILQNVDGVENQDIVNAYIKDLGLSGTLQMAKDGSKGKGQLSVTQSGIELIGASLYKEGQEVGINIPKILETPYAINVNSFVEDYKKSALYELMGGQEIDEESLAEVKEVMTAFSDYMVGAMNLSTNQEFKQQSKALQAKFIKEAALTEKAQTNLLLSNGKEKECRVYAGTLTGSEMTQFFKDGTNILMDLEFVKNYFEVIGEQAGYTMEELQAELDSLEVDGENATLDIEFLIDDTYLVGVNIHVMDIKTNESLGTVVFNYCGEKNLTDAIYFNLNMPPVDDESESVGIQFTWHQNLGEKPDVITQDLVCSISENDLQIGNFTYSYAYDTKGAEDNLKISFGMKDQDEMTLDYSGSGTKTISNSEVSTHLTQATLKAQDENGNFTLGFGLNYGIKAINASDVVIDKTGVKYIFEMTQEELIDAVEKIQTNFQILTSAFLYT